MQVCFRLFSGFQFSVPFSLPFLNFQGWIHPWNLTLQWWFWKLRQCIIIILRTHSDHVADDNSIFHHGLICFHPIFGVWWRSSLTLILFNSVFGNHQLDLATWQMMLLFMILLHDLVEFWGLGTCWLYMCFYVAISVSLVAGWNILEGMTLKMVWWCLQVGLKSL